LIDLEKNDADANTAINFRVQGDAFFDLPPRERILAATYETILEDQISGTRLRKIAKKAGIAQGHLHYYFASKDELLFELLDRIIDSFHEERNLLLQDPNKSCLEKLFVFFDLKLDDINEEGHDVVLFDYWVQSASNEVIRKNMDRFYRPWRETINQVVQAGVKSGEFNSKYAEVLPSFMISVMDGAALQYLIDRKNFDLQEYFQEAREMISELVKKQTAK
jgi:TetR/AcrR family transcriptional regulator